MYFFVCNISLEKELLNLEFLTFVFFFKNKKQYECSRLYKKSSEGRIALTH